MAIFSFYLEISSNRFYKDSNESPLHLESEPVSGCKLLGSAPLYNQSDDNLSEVFQSRQDHFSDQAPEIMIGPLLNQFAETLPLENGFLGILMFNIFFKNFI